MSLGVSCRCCLVRPPDKDLKSSYKKLGKTEVYADMLKECFEIHLDAVEGESGICEVCITRLRDAYDFKSQVQQCQKELQTKVKSDVKDETTLKVKEEVDLVDNDIYFLELKEEMSDYEDSKNDSDQLAEMFSFGDVTMKKKTVVKKKNGKKRSLAIEKNTSGKDRKSSAILSGPIKIIQAFSQMEKGTLKKPRNITISSKSRLPTITFISESKKHQLNIQNVLKHSNCTPFSNKTLAGIFCAYCKESYPDLPTLRKHTQETHKNEDIHENKRMDRNNICVKMDITDLKCSLCNASFDVVVNLKKHLTKEHDIKFYPDVNDYILEFKLTETEILNCALCNSTFETFKMLLQHMNGHYRNYICDVCDMGFINQHRLKNHQRTHEVGSFKCAFCDKVFTTRVRKMCHEKYTHNSSARYTTACPHCDKSFTSYYQRNRHMFQEHNVAAATYKCNICDKSFILKSKLTSHIKKVHLMERNHICPECGQGFFIKQSLDEHMVKHNGERVFKCTVCHKAYARKKTLREHMRIHNNDRRFKCGVCGSAFVQKCSLKSHMLSNHGITLSEYETFKT